MSLFHSHSPFRIFFVSGLLTLAALFFVGYELGPAALFLTMALIAIEVTFSFDNAIINARVLTTMSPFWRTMFITLGVLIAVFGMRVIFPVLVVMLTSGLGWGEVVHLALNEPKEYARELTESHTAIASFGGMFLLMLGLHFFFDESRKVWWIRFVEEPLQRIGSWWMASLICFAALTICALIPLNHHPIDTMIAGTIGIVTYLIIHGLTALFTKNREEEGAVAAPNKKAVVLKTGMAGFISFMYLEVLDASFSFDGVIGAFAITNDVVLIAIGLGIGALWVRSLTIFMVRRQVLGTYRYLEHGAHYTIGLLAFVLLLGLFFEIPEAIAGLFGILIIGLSVASSIRAARAEAQHTVQ